MDWSHLTMKLTVLQQCARGLPPSPAAVDDDDEEPLERRLESAKHSLWHGDSAMALDRLEEVDLALTGWGCDEEGEPLSGVDRTAAVRMRKYGRELAAYIRNNATAIVNDGERDRNGERISAACTESTINQVVSKRMVKRQQRPWTPTGTHLLLPVRTQVLGDAWEATFRSWYPRFRPAPLAVDAAA